MSGWTALLPYYGVFTAAIVEGEITYIAAAALVAEGRLNPAAVVIAGALGAAIGDQAFFYAFRGRLARWAARSPSLQRAAAPLLRHVRRREGLMVGLIRFAPGLRVALALACAWANVPAIKFSTINLISSLLWAVALLIAVGWAGPTFFGRFGLTGWKGGLVAGIAAFALLKYFGARERRSLQKEE